MFSRSRLPALRMLLPALLAAAGCATNDPPPSKPAEKSVPIDLETFRQLAKVRQQYVDALLLCGSTSPRDWVQAKQQLELLPPNYHLFDEDPELIRKFRGGDDKARMELGRRGRILSDLNVFTRGYDKDKWDRAQKELMDEGEPGQILLTTTLIDLLMNVQFQEEWDHVRTVLVETGPIAFDTVVGWTRRLIDDTPADTPIFRIERLTQAITALIWFGDKGAPLVAEFSKAPKTNVRRACARAIGDAMHAPSAPVLVRMLSEDPEWVIRTVAATALGRMSGAKAVAGAGLLDRLKKERDRVVLGTILESLGSLKVEEAVPDLVKVLDHPNVDMANRAMTSLYRITGQRLTRKEDWLQWYAASYPAWRSRIPR